MSATTSHSEAIAPAGTSGNAARPGLSEATLAESLRVLLTGIVPALARGLFSPRPGAMKLLTRLEADRRAVSTLAGLRRKYGGDGLRLLRGKIIVVWGVPAITEVLERSSEEFAGDSGAKAKGMAHFQPDALTLSRGEPWRDRRRFTEAVLATGDWVHPFAQRFLAVVSDEIGRLDIGDQLTYDEWAGLFDHITLRVIFGDAARDDQHLTDLLERLMGEANRLVGLSRGDDYYEFYGALEQHLRDPQPDSLIARFADAPHTDETRMVQQIPHWIFAMRDTLAANAYRALAAIVSNPSILNRVHEELGGIDVRDPTVVDGLRYLEGCLQEAMRLWPTTPLLAREATTDTTLVGEPVDEGTQVMLVNVFNHRDADTVEDADQITPERWASRERDLRFNHLSNGRQDCPGGPLVLLLGKAVLAAVLQRFNLSLTAPELPTEGALPMMLDFYAITLRVGPRRSR
jgi:cytochrome P450